MILARIHIAAFLLVLGLCNAETIGSREIKVNDSDSVADVTVDAAKTEDESEEDERDNEMVEEMLPILPPIILLDFDNGTSDDNVTADEKSKRTVNNGLGYGFERNSLHAPRKYNYYFPAGKTGTTVSIEESISPFLPRTIIEKIPPSNQKPIIGTYTELRQQGYKTHVSTGSSSQSTANYQYYEPAAKSQPVFGMRTKLTKTTVSEPYGDFVPIASPSVEPPYSNVDYRNNAYVSTTPQSAVYGNTETVEYATPSPQGYTASSSSRYTYVTPSPTSYIDVNSQRYLGPSSQHAINVQSYAVPTMQNAIESSTTSSPPDTAAYLESIGVQTRGGPHDYVRSSSNTVESSTSAPGEVTGYAGQNARPPYATGLPRYTVENGVRYENKIFWKYPDGRVSDTPPMTYETYSEYPSLAALQAAKSQETSQIYESSPTAPTASGGTVLSQGPAQFPMAPESDSPPTPFISAGSLSKLQQQQTYRLGYQRLVGQKQNGPQQIKAGSGVSPMYSVTSTTPSPSRNPFKSNGKSQKGRYETFKRPISSYMINGPNPEYINSYKIDSVPKSTIPSRPYALPVGENPVRKSNTNGKNLDGYSNLQYTDLLSYNPSISQYIKNPASILKVQPTFVQTGNSLIPVIILRVDGVPPIEPKAMPNVNLKALLQQYLIQYAKSLEELARPSNYNFGNDQPSKDQNSFSANSLRELARLAQNNRAQDLLGNPTESYVGRSSYETSNLELDKSLSSGKYGERTATRPKVKSVQIIEDPRFPNYRVKN